MSSGVIHDFLETPHVKMMWKISEESEEIVFPLVDTP